MKEKLNYLDCLFENLGLADSGDWLQDGFHLDAILAQIHHFIQVS